jgi:hypothetical protein
MAIYAEDITVEKKDPLENIGDVCMDDNIILSVFNLKKKALIL